MGGDSALVLGKGCPSSATASDRHGPTGHEPHPRVSWPTPTGWAFCRLVRDVCRALRIQTVGNRPLTHEAGDDCNQPQAFVEQWEAALQRLLTLELCLRRADIARSGQSRMTALERRS